MGKIATVKSTGAVLVLLATLGAGQAAAQTPAPRPPEWRHVGNALVDFDLAGLASGPVERVWYVEGGSKLRILTALERVFETTDFETWAPAPEGASPPAMVSGFAATLPEQDAHARNPATPSPRVYAFGEFVHRSEDSGRHWENTTGYRGFSIIGKGVHDLAVSPANEEEIATATGTGVFRSLDGGRTWHGLNEALPNLPGARLRAVPSADRGVAIELADALLLEWQPGERLSWKVADDEGPQIDLELRRVLEPVLGAPVTAVARVGSYIYAGLADGRIAVSSGTLWTYSLAEGRGPVNAFWVDPIDPRLALAVFGTRAHGPQTIPARILRTFNGGIWDDVSANLPDAAVTGVAADRSSNAVYVATAAGLFLARMPLSTLGAAPNWGAVNGLPPARVSDVRLDAGGIQLWAALEGPGVYSTLAPHRLGDPRVVSSADLLARAAAPGALFTVAGARLESASAGGIRVPVLVAADTESQIQIPFEVTGASLTLDVTGSAGNRVLSPLALNTTAPGILVDGDGSPLLLDADRGVRLDGITPARSRMRVQIFATGLGRVRPDWPAGTPAPFENLPEVVAPVSAYLDREPVEVLRAVLAPGYIGVYLVEIEVPTLVNAGAAELYIEAGGQSSNRVRVYIEPF